MPIGRLEPVPLRDLWKHEERHFTRWLADNISALSEELGMSLEVLEREKRVGSFELDLLATDGQERVIIENQLGGTNHDHLGKVLTYATNLEAKVAVWVVSEVRPEHARAVQWLNETTPDDVSFYLVRVAAYRIGDSDPAPQFTVIVGPSQEVKSIGQEKKDLAAQEVRWVGFWDQLLQRARKRGVRWHETVSPTKEATLWAGAGVSDLYFTYHVGRAGLEVYLWMSSKDRDRNKRIFDVLHAKEDEIERDFGGALHFDRRDNQKGSYIIAPIDASVSLDDESRWPGVQEKMITAMDDLAQALQPHLRLLRG